jgi:DNA-binding LytR/AlgR family response regulator
VEAFQLLKKSKVDLLFLDIEMPRMNGLELVKSLQHKPEVIITTAYREYAVEGFELDVLDYLVKPIPIDRFLASIDRFINKMEALHKGDIVLRDSIFVRADRKELKIQLDEVLYVEGLKDYVKIVMRGSQVMTKVSIGHFEEKLPATKFVRVHKSFIVAIDKITAYTAHDVEIGEIEIPIGRVYKDTFRDRMQFLAD